MEASTGHLITSQWVVCLEKMEQCVDRNKPLKRGDRIAGLDTIQHTKVLN